MDEEGSTSAPEVYIFFNFHNFYFGRILLGATVDEVTNRHTSVKLS